jgi:hypothetical protein
MPLDLIGAALIGPVHNQGPGAALQCLDARELELDLIVRMLQRDDPSRRSYLQRRWQSQVGSCNCRALGLERKTAQAPID